MTTYLLIDGRKIALEDPYFTPTEGMIVNVEDKKYSVHIKNILHVQGQAADIEVELQCTAL
jgi:hypothetical protein